MTPEMRKEWRRICDRLRVQRGHSPLGEWNESEDSKMPSGLGLVSAATHEEIITGDFVRLGSGSPIGLVAEVSGETASGTWLTAGFPRFSLPWVCLRQSSAGPERDAP